ncbi:MAG: thermonuclease family protein [Hyphomonadaceae bacterium]|nr:thermonuclease family protein [Hyphomonadaceae bacterium]
MAQTQSSKRGFKDRRDQAQFVIALCAIGVVALLQVIAAEPSRAELTRQVRASAEFSAIDGDTIERRTTGERIRLANVDTAETGNRAQCRAELAHGEDAKLRVQDLLRAAARVEVEPIGRTDAYGRTIAVVAVDGRDLGEVLIAESLARPWRGRREPWCGPNGRLLP